MMGRGGDVRYLFLLAVAACAKDPLENGGYTIIMTTFTNDTCGYTDERAGVGSAWNADLSWDDNDIVLDGFKADTTYDNQVDYWAAASDSARETGVCIETFTESHQLTIVSETEFEIDANLRLGKSGNCDGVDTPAPCTYDLVYTGVKQ